MDGKVWQKPPGASFFQEATGRISKRDLILPASLMLVVLTSSNIVLLLSLPREGELPSAAAILAIAVRIGGLAFVGVALLRALVHALIDFRLIEGVGDLFWPLALLDGVLSLAIILFGFAFNATAYRRAVSH